MCGKDTFFYSYDQIFRQKVTIRITVIPSCTTEGIAGIPVNPSVMTEGIPVIRVIPSVIKERTSCI